MVMVDTQVVKGGRAGRDFHESHAKYRLRAAKRVVAVDYLGLPVGARVVGACRHEVAAAPGPTRCSTAPASSGVPGAGRPGLCGLEGPLAREHAVRVEIKNRDRVKASSSP